MRCPVRARVRGARAGGARAVRRVGRADRGRARGAHGAGAPPADRRASTTGPGAPAPDSGAITPEETFLHAARARAAPCSDRPSTSAAAGRGASAARAPSSRPSARRGARQLVQRRRHRRDLARSGSVSATISRCTAGSTRTAVRPLGPYRLQRQLRQHGHPQARADQADHRRVVVGREVDARGEARALADLDQMAAAARAARDPGLVGQLADRRPCPRAASRCPSGTRPTSRSVSSGRTTRSSHSAPAAGSRRAPPVAEGERDSQSPSRSISTERGGSASTRETRVPGWAARIGGERGRHQRGAAAGEGHQPDPARPQPGDGGDLLLGGGEPGEDARRRAVRAPRPPGSAASRGPRGPAAGCRRTAPGPSSAG